jgi:2-polyprenyl-3-methyl-5-hydroxy-6-metoxy-1,4-benzoquinol methylase
MFNMDFESHNCPCCQSSDYKIVVSGPDLLTGLPGLFQFVECTECGLLRQEPRLSWHNLITYYPPDYVSHQPLPVEEKNILTKTARRYGLQKRVHFIKKYVPSGKWLDVGCGSGLILSEAKYADCWTLEGLEPVTKQALSTATKLDIPVHNSNFEEFDAPNSSYDLITMFDVLEHLLNPTEGIKKISRLLRSNGYFIFAIPNLNSYDRKLFKDYWVGYDLPRHLFLYPLDLLQKMLSTFSLHIISSKCIAGAHGALKMNLMFYNRKTKSPFIDFLVYNKIGNVMLKGIDFLPLFISDLLRQSTDIVYVAKKIDRSQNAAKNN